MSLLIKKFACAASVAIATSSGLGAAHAASLLTGLGGDSGFGEIALSPNDDSTSNALSLPFGVNFFGTAWTSFFVNNNGNVTFARELSEYTPTAFPVANQPLIAPWWADVDTTSRVGLLSPFQNNVYIASPNSNTVVVTWHDVGYYSSNNDKKNNFQLVLRNRADTGNGNFDIDFRYQKLEWTTGDSSGGLNGLGGTPAQAGYDDGLGRNFLTLPGSRTGDILNIVNTSNVADNTPGLWTFAVRNGQTPGSEASNPLLPVFVDGSYSFNFNVQLNQRVFVDPLVAVGYDFVLGDTTSPSFQSVLLPNVGDGLFELLLWNGSQYVNAASLTAGIAYSFVGSDVRRFRITGIEVSAGLDPADTTAFVTGLTFNGAGAVALMQTPLTFNTTPVPEPSSYALMGLGLAAVFGAKLRSRRAAA